MKEEDKSKLAKKLSKAKDWKMVAMEKRKKKELNLGGNDGIKNG